MTATPPLTSAATLALPPTIAGAIFDSITEQSAVMSSGQQVALALTAGTEIPVFGDLPIATFPGEGGRAAVGSAAPASGLTMSAKRLAVTIGLSREVVQTNPAGVYDQLAKDLPSAFARAFDFAAIHGVTITGADSPFTGAILGPDLYASQWVALGTATKADGGLWADLVAGEAAVTNQGYDFSGIIADPRLISQVRGAADNNGQPVFMTLPQLGQVAPGANSGRTLIGYPVALTRSVSGLMRRQSTLTTDSTLRAIGGDFSQTAWGVGQALNVRLSTEGTYVDSSGAIHSAVQDGLVIVQAEAYFGLVVRDQNAFVSYVSVAPTEPEG